MNKNTFRYKSLTNVTICKQDCDFSLLISAGYSNDIQGFYRNITQYLQPNVAATCGKTTVGLSTSTPMLGTTTSMLSTTTPSASSLGIINLKDVTFYFLFKIIA